MIYRRHLRHSTSISSSLRTQRLCFKFSDSFPPSLSFASHLPYLFLLGSLHHYLLTSSFPYLLPSSVSRKSFASHSCENCRGAYQQFPFWNFRIPRRFDVQTFRRFNVATLPHPPKSLPFNPFADPHPLNLYAPIFYKNSGGRGCPPYSSRATVHGSRSTERATSSCISIRSGIHVSQLTVARNSGRRYR